MLCQGLLPPACLGSWPWEVEAWRQREELKQELSQGVQARAGRSVKAWLQWRRKSKGWAEGLEPGCKLPPGSQP